MWCCRSDWSGLCFAVLNPHILSANRVDLGHFFVFSIFIPPPPDYPPEPLSEVRRIANWAEDDLRSAMGRRGCRAQRCHSRVGGGGRNDSIGGSLWSHNLAIVTFLARTVWSRATTTSWRSVTRCSLLLATLRQWNGQLMLPRVGC